jgi:hypothetical protein
MNVGAYLAGAEIATWHPIPGTNAEVKIRLLRPKRLRELQAQSRKKVYAGRRSEETSDSTLLHQFMLEELVADWKNVEQTDGTPLPCTPENKRLLDDNWPAFNRLWNAVWLEQMEAETDASEEGRKN